MARTSDLPREARALLIALSLDEGETDRVVWDAACRAYGSGGLLQQLRSGNALGDVANSLRSTWPSVSVETFPNRYRQALAVLQDGS